MAQKGVSQRQAMLCKSESGRPFWGGEKEMRADGRSLGRQGTGPGGLVLTGAPSVAMKPGAG